ncbi:SDR family oxidoreductase [Streptomyces sp. SID5643]|uniref:SDR family oxidoreductase n=1 Tax=Streptomyces sp. SID5643 TaxID=2690307 RepID=UPI00136EC8C7|nr:SDR family oxidoreductase [Streptomyces sp. SID5643]MZF87944.1 SDR family oxidoreductase [Streptomyces sp. SID5643]
MKAVVHRGARTLGTEIESRVAEAPAPAKEWGTPAPANQWGACGVDAEAVAPGCVATHDTEALRADPRRDRAVLGRMPAGRCRRADDPAGATAFSASPASDHVNALVLPVDGGRLGR